MQADRIFQSTDETVTRVWLFYFRHEQDYTLDMTQPKIFVTRLIPNPGQLYIKEHFHPDIWTQDLPPSREELIERARGVDGLLCMLTEKIDGDVMDAIGRQLKVISNMAVGVDNNDIAAAAARRISGWDES